MVIENLKPDSLCALRLVYDHIASTKKSIHEMEITNKMVTSCKTAYSRYSQALEDAKKQSKVTGKEKREMIQTEIRDVKRRQMEVMTCVVTLEKDVEKCCDGADAKPDIPLFLKSNALRTSIKEIEQVAKDLDSATINLEQEVKKV